MVKNQINVAVIPARSGSKRLKNKNILNFNGHPMISWSIKLALKTKLFDYVVVSTNSKKIAHISKKNGVIVPFIRCKKLSNDFTPIKDVISDAITQLEIINIVADNICCIYPCSPLIEVADIKNSYKKFIKNKMNYLMAVSKYSHPIERALIIDKKKLKPISKKNMNIRTQDLKDSYFDAGNFYWGKKSSWKNKKNIFQSCDFYELPIIRSVDLDTHQDLDRLKKLFKLL